MTGSESGIYNFIKSRNPIEDKWYSLSLLDNGILNYTDNNLDQSPSLLVAVIFSLIIAFYTVISSLQVMIIFINFSYYAICDRINHQSRYIKLDVNKHNHIKKQEHPQNEDQPVRKYNFKALLMNSPSPSAYIDALILMGYRQLMNSVSEFYRILFRPIAKKDEDLENPDPSKDLISGNDLKGLYEKFCFLNFMTEQKLTDPQNLKRLEVFNFEIFSDPSLISEVFTKCLLKAEDDIGVATKLDDKSDSLDVFIKEALTLSAFEED
jgi:hypothetical protein